MKRKVHPSGYEFVDLTSSLSHALVAGQEDQFKAIITNLRYKLAPQPKPPRKRSRLAEFFSPTTY
jgi:hypothetical protein